MSENEEIKFIDDVEEDVPPVPPDFNHLTNKKNSKDSTETKTTTTTTTTNKRSLRASVKKNQSNQITVGYNKTDDLPSFGDDRNSESILPVLEILDQMKTYAKISQNKLEFQKAKNSRKQKIFGSKLTDDSSFCSPKKIKEYLVSIRSNLYYFLERPVGMIGLFYRLFTFTLIVGSIITGSLTTFKSMDSWSLSLLYWYEIFATTFFSSEFFLRTWSSGHRINGFSKFLRRPLILIEVTVILMSICVLIFGTIGPLEKYHERHFNSEALLLIRFFQILRLFYVDRHAQTWILVLKTVNKHKFELITSVYIATIILLFSSYLILIVEKPRSDKNQDNMFHTFADAMYWSIITMTTIGYGDRSPQTFYGKMISNTLCVVGIAFWTLPGGIIGSGFALKVEQRNKKRQFNRLLPAAASLIQAWWRMKATMYLSSSNVSCMLATVNTFDITKPINRSNSVGIWQKNFERNSVNMNQFFNGIDSPQAKVESVRLVDEIEKSEDKPSIINRPKSARESKLTYTSVTSYYNTTQSNCYSTTIFSSATLNKKYSKMLLQLSPEHLILIRMILLLRFLAAKSKFKLAFKPYDFKDVIEQYTQGNMDILLKMKDLQRKIEQIAICIPQGNIANSNESDYGYYHSSNITLRPPSPKLEFQDFNKTFQNGKQTPGYKSTSTAHLAPAASSNETQQQLTDRVKRIEANLDSLSKKLDILIKNIPDQ